MKTITKLVCLIFALFLVGCNYPMGDFVTGNPCIIKKSQYIDDKNKKVAQYIVQFSYTSGGPPKSTTYTFPENFGNVSDHIIFTNGTQMIAVPPSAIKPEN